MEAKRSGGNPVMNEPDSDEEGSKEFLLQAETANADQQPGLADLMLIPEPSLVPHGQS